MYRGRAPTTPDDDDGIPDILLDERVGVAVVGSGVVTGGCCVPPPLPSSPPPTAGVWLSEVRVVVVVAVDL